MPRVRLVGGPSHGVFVRWTEPLDTFSAIEKPEGAYRYDVGRRIFVWYPTDGELELELETSNAPGNGIVDIASRRKTT
jgi:hypothetical protein